MALHRLSLTVGPGQIYCLLGANGAGKTTALRILAGLAEPSGGRASVGGIDAVRHPARAKAAVSYVAENVALYQYLTARENLRFFAALGGRPRITSQALTEAMDRVGFPTGAADRRTSRLSKGMRQKLALAIAFLKDAPVLLLDEPTSGLDPAASGEILSILDEFRDRGSAVLVSTHDIFRAQGVADRVGILKNGRKIYEGSREDLRSRDLETLYLSYMSEGPVPDARPHALRGQAGTVRKREAPP